MLQIRSVHFLPDGRSVVDTIGGKRFRVVSRGMRDGYSIANIQYLEDMKVCISHGFFDYCNVEECRKIMLNVIVEHSGLNNNNIYNVNTKYRFLSMTNYLHFL